MNDFLRNSVKIYVYLGSWPISHTSSYLENAFVFYTRRDEILSIAEEMDRHVEKLSRENDEGKLKHFLNCQRRSRAIGQFFWNTTFGTIFVMYAWPVFIIFRKGDYSLRPLGVRTYLPFSLNATGNYVVAYAGEIILGSAMTMHTIAFDTFFVGCILFAIARLRSLQLSIEAVGLDMKKKLRAQNNVGPWEEENFFQQFRVTSRTELKKCVEEHQEIFALCKIIDSMLSLTLFVVFFIYAGIICLVGFNAMLLGPSWNLLKLGQYLGALLVQICLYYWHGNELMTESLKVADSAVRCDWYDFGESNIKTIVFIIFRSQKPILLTAGKFYKVTLETFLLLLSSSYSYFAILKQFYE
ncbi:odorant receptor Or2-like isoform X2 [Athalia rosae]|uniref:odorant receptor Or2-like isoform X2 n=1 Tax=Athalia rosae TaxID=37344 RepID=UPI0020340CE4|nr:odorant receptor Or2-like isoform X2 [Athalia rosae]